MAAKALFLTYLKGEGHCMLVGRADSPTHPPQLMLTHTHTHTHTHIVKCMHVAKQPCRSEGVNFDIAGNLSSESESAGHVNRSGLVGMSTK